VFVSALAFTGLPAGPLLALGAGCAAIGWILQSSKSSVPTTQPASLPEPAPAPTPAAVESKTALRIESLELELGIGLLRLADSASGGDLLQHITQLRHRIADELGFIVPKVRVTDNLRLDPRQFQIKLRGVPVAWGEAYADALLAVDVGGAADAVPGIQTHEPATQRPARWIQPEQREAAIVAGWQVHSPQVFLIQQLAEVVRSHAAELLTRQQVQGLLNDLRSRVPQLVDELIPGVLKSAHVQQVLCNLLRERVAIRDLEVIIEALGQCCGRTTNPTLLTEGVRLALARTIVQQCRGTDRVLHAVALSDELEHALADSIHFDEHDLRVNATQTVRTALTSGLRERLKRLVLAGRHEVVVCRPEIRAGVRQLTARDFPRLSVLSHHEVTADTELVVHGTVDLLTTATTSQSAVPVNRIQRHTESVHAAERFARRETVTLATGGAR
jgi:flagellar biosynthesis protein FlhA